MRTVILCLLLINILYNTYCLLDEEKSEEELRSPWHQVLGPYGDLKDRAKPIKATKNEDKLFYQSGYGLMGRPYYPIQYIPEFLGYPFFGEMMYQPNGWYSGAIASSSNLLVKKDKTTSNFLIGQV